MGIVVSSCKGKSSAKYEPSPKHRLNRETPSKREQRFKTYKISNRPKKTRQFEQKRLTPCQNSSGTLCHCKSLDFLDKSDKCCQVDIEKTKSLVHRTTSTKILSLKSRSVSPTKAKMNHRRPKHSDLYYHHYHHHHHYHHRNHRGS
ncbi:hypothetical protein BpHYR1_046908, partial [Brachionus plicatilis]